MRDALLWAQTIILFVTGVIVAWYTWETHKIRKDAAAQNKLIARQVELMHESLQFELTREQQASEPIFKWQGGGSNHASAINRFDRHCDFQNAGGAVTDLEVKTDGSFTASITPKDHLDETQKGTVNFSRYGVSTLSDVNFEIHYTTRLKKPSKKSFCPSQQS
ncbi:MAG TPA: hypothetical protein VGM58_00295 [Verrucomicrobiae bacterium]|jgi:hypothetical protein